MASFEEEIASALGELLPAMEADGGGAEIVSCCDGTLTLRLIGSCVFCPSRALSAAALEKRLKERVPALNFLFLDQPVVRAVGSPSFVKVQTNSNAI